MITVDMPEVKANDAERAIAILRDEVFPLYLRYWDEEVRPLSNQPFNPHLQLFIEMWFSGGLKLVIAKENAVTVGFATCIVFRPLQYQATVLQIHDAYASRRADVQQEMSNYISTMAKILGCNEIWVDGNIRWTVSLPIQWKEYAPCANKIYRLE